MADAEEPVDLPVQTFQIGFWKFPQGSPDRYMVWDLLNAMFCAGFPVLIDVDFSFSVALFMPSLNYDCEDSGFEVYWRSSSRLLLPGRWNSVYSFLSRLEESF